MSTEDWSNREYQWMKLRESANRYFKDIPDPTREMCLEAVRQEGACLMHIEIQDEEIVLEAVRNNGGALMYAKVQTPEIVNTAIFTHPDLLDYIEDQTPQMVASALRTGECDLTDVKIPITKELALIAVSAMGINLKFVPKEEQTEEMCRNAVWQNPWAIEHAQYQLPWLCMFALVRDGYTIRMIREPTVPMYITAFEENHKALRWIDEFFHAEILKYCEVPEDADLESECQGQCPQHGFRCASYESHPKDHTCRGSNGEYNPFGGMMRHYFITLEEEQKAQEDCQHTWYERGHERRCMHCDLIEGTPASE